MGVEMRVSMGEGEGRNEVNQQGATPLTVERRSAVYLRKDATEVSQENGGGRREGSYGGSDIYPEESIPDGDGDGDGVDRGGGRKGEEVPRGGVGGRRGRCRRGRMLGRRRS